MRLFVMCLGLIVAGCSAAPEPEGPKAEREFRMVHRSSPTPEQECAAATAVRDAHLKDENHGEFDHWKMRADSLCTLAWTERQL